MKMTCVSTVEDKNFLVRAMGSIREYLETEAVDTHILEIKSPGKTKLNGKTLQKWIRGKFVCICHGLIMFIRAPRDYLLHRFRFALACIISCCVIFGGNLWARAGTRDQPNPERLRMPMAYELMPHLLNDFESSLTPAFKMGGGRNAVDFVIGIPTVKRENVTYLHITLTHLVKGMTKEQSSSVLIIVFVAETDLKYVLEVAKNIETTFPSEVGNGLIEVFSPSPSYYPNFENLRPTLNDPWKRFKWRTKENLDAIYLMSYAYPRGKYYLMMEDDVVAKKDYIGSMKNFTEKTSKANPDWVFIEFCTIGSVGKLFKKSTSLQFIIYVQLFYTNMPIDWLLESWLMDKVCPMNKDLTKCDSRRLEIRPRYNKPLFQHIGFYSSLKGKIQELKDKKFGSMELFFPHKNPPIWAARTNIEVYKKQDLRQAYEGFTFFWGVNPKAGATMEFWFKKPTRLQSFLFRSSNAEHAGDTLLDCVVEVLPLGNNWTYLTVGAFNEFGLAEGEIVTPVVPLLSLRLRMTKDSKHWVILSEIHLKPLELDTYTGSKKLWTESTERMQFMQLTYNSDEMKQAQSKKEAKI